MVGTVIYGSLTHPNWNDRAMLLQFSFSKFPRGGNVLLVLKIVCEYYFDFWWWICYAVIKIVVCHWVIWQNWNSDMSLENSYFIHHSTRRFVLLSKFTLKKCMYSTKHKSCGDILYWSQTGVFHWLGVFHWHIDHCISSLQWHNNRW
jgi:hypothetical protein